MRTNQLLTVYEGQYIEESCSNVCDWIDTLNNALVQRLMTLKGLTLVESWVFFCLKISLFGCNVARAFSPSCSF